MIASAQTRTRLPVIGSGRRQARTLPALPSMRWINFARAGYGVALLVLPTPLISGATGYPASARVRGVARVLGGRQLAQGTICGLAPERGLIRAGAAADALHASSMLLLAAAEPRLRKALLADATIAAALAWGGVRAGMADRRVRSQAPSG